MVPSLEVVLIQLQELRAELAAVKAENAWLKRQLFGPGKSEKLDRLQASLPLGDVPVVPQRADGVATSRWGQAEYCCISPSTHALQQVAQEFAAFLLKPALAGGVVGQLGFRRLRPTNQRVRPPKSST